MNTLAPFFAFSLALVGITFSTSSLLQAQTVTPTSTAYSFGNIDICPAGKATPAPCSANHTVSFNVAAGTTIGGIAIVLGGAPGLDFKAEADDTSTTLCTAKLYTEATTCTVDVTFAPLAPGARNGAVEILNSGGGQLATSYVYGIGVGPQIAFSPAAYLFRSLGGAGGYLPNEVAVDGSGNLFVTVIAEGNGALEELTAASGYNQVNVLTSTIGYFDAIALDGAGNLFLAGTPRGQTNADVVEIFAKGGYTAAKIVIPYLSDFSVTNGMAIDGAGNLFFTVGASVQEFLVADGYATAKTLHSGFYTPAGIAVDGSGNVFVADYNSGVKEIVAASGYTTVKTLHTGSKNYFFLAVDAAGDIFVIPDGGSSRALLELVAAGGYTAVDEPFSLPGSSSFGNFTGVAVDGSGNIFTAGTGGEILELRRSQPSSLQFAPARVDSTGTPLPVTVQNSGNATLTASGLAFTDSDDFARAAGSGTPPDCAAGFSLAPSEQCNVRIDFTPASGGTLSGSAVVTDNSENATAATQSIALSGNGITAGGPVARVSATALTYGSVANPGTATQSLAISNTGGGKLTIGPSVSSLNYTVTGNTCAGGVTTGSCILQVEFTPTSIGPQPNHLTLATNGPANPVISLTGTATGVGAVNLGSAEFGVQQPVTSVQFGTIYFPSAANAVSFSVKNYGITGAVTVQTSIDGPDYKITSNNCQGIAANNVCEIGVVFSPLSLGGHYEHLTLIPNIGSPSTIELIGTAGGTVP